MKLSELRFITSEVAESPRFFRSFTLASSPRKARLVITGLGLYTAFINGKKAGDAYLAPGFNDYDGYLRYEEIDVTDLLQEGENRIEVYLGNGWYKGRFGLMSFTNSWGKEYLLAAGLEGELSDGETFCIMTDDSWKASESCIRSDSIYDGEVRDDTFIPEKEYPCSVVDGNVPEDADLAGKPAGQEQPERFPCDAVIPGPEGRVYRLTSQLCPPIRVKLTRKPELIHTPAGETVLDFGQNLAGIVRVHNRMAAGETVHLTFGEILLNGNFCNSNYRDATGGFTYTSDGAEKDVEPLFTYFGFRYAKVEITSADGSKAGEDRICPEDYTALVLYTDLKETMQVHTSNALLNRLLENSLWGQRSNFLDVPTDCPQRNERLGWTGDAQVFAGTACFHMNCEDFYRKYLRDLRFDQTAYMHGDIPMFSPCQKDGAPGGPAWADAAVVIPWTMYEQYGNRAYLEEAYPMMRDYMEVLIRKDQQDGGSHILTSGHCFGDWLALDGASPNAFKGGTDDVYVRSVYYWYAADLLAKASRELGLTADHQQYRQLADEIRMAIIGEFFSRTGRLCIDTQTGYVLALHFGLYPNKEKLIEGFKERLSKDMLKLKTGFVGTGFLLQTLFENGMGDYAYRMLFAEAYPGWLYAVKMGATTIWERWNSVMPDGSLSPTGMNSLNHYSYGAVASAVYSCVAGLKNAAPGWRRAVIEPHPDRRLRQISVSFDSPAGTWQSAWEILPDGSFRMEVTVPEGTSARLQLPYYPGECMKAEGFGEGKPGASGAAELKAGHYVCQYMPSVDFFHPYSGDTFIADIVADENAVQALKTAIPGAFDEALAGVDNGAATNLAGAIFFTPIPDLPKKIDEILRSVRYEVQ